jgi:hypothetical protein
MKTQPRLMSLAARLYRHPMLRVTGFQITEDLLTTRVAQQQKHFLLACFLEYADVVNSVNPEKEYGQTCLQVLLSIVRGNDYARAGPNRIPDRDTDFMVHRDDKLINLQGLLLGMFYLMGTEDPAAETNPAFVDAAGVIRPGPILSCVFKLIESTPGLKAKIFPNWTSDPDNIVVKTLLESERAGQRKNLFDFLQWKLAEMSLFRLENTNILGAIYHDFQPNDQLWFLNGLNIPAVLRRRVAPGVFRLMGPAYVHGYMHGEILEKEWAKYEREIALV